MAKRLLLKNGLVICLGKVVAKLKITVLKILDLVEVVYLTNHSTDKHET